jgi:hypothetical protein
MPGASWEEAAPTNSTVAPSRREKCEAGHSVQEQSAAEDDLAVGRATFSSIEMRVATPAGLEPATCGLEIRCSSS